MGVKTTYKLNNITIELNIDVLATDKQQPEKHKDIVFY